MMSSATQMDLMREVWGWEEVPEDSLLLKTPDLRLPAVKFSPLSGAPKQPWRPSKLQEEKP